MGDLSRPRYRAFLSYSHRDREWGEWLHKTLERTRIDRDLVGRETAVGTVPRSLRPIFRDREDFSAGGSLAEQTVAALKASEFLIVLCSPNAAQRLLMRALQFVGEGEKSSDPFAEMFDAKRTQTVSASRVETLRLVLDAESMSERDRLGRFLPWLATIGSASPLIGLLGTVLGIIAAFVGIATRGSGNLAAVAPGVAEALIATAAALSVAIPATFGYNILANRLNRLDNLLEGFGTTVIAMLVREGRL